MTATTRAAFWRGMFWVLVYLGLVLAPLVVLLAGPQPPPRGIWWDSAIALGFAGLAMMGVQFILTARFKRATAPFGIDLIYYFHRYAAVVAFIIVLAHPVILFVEDPELLASLNPLTAPWEMTVGVFSVLALVVVMVTSLFRKALRLSYEAWRYLHTALSTAAVLLALLHVQGVGVYVSEPWKRVTWGLLTVSWVAALAWVRVLKPWRLSRRPYRVASVTRERGDAWVLALEPEGHEGFQFLPGQFSWVTLRASPFAMKEHPFSMSSCAEPGGRLEFTIKELGDFTRTLGTVQPGERAYVDGPYGAFSVDLLPSKHGYGFLAGGIGIAPMLSMLRALAERGDTREHTLVYAYRREERLTAREVIDALAERLKLRVVYVLEEPPGNWSGERGRITAELLARHLPAHRAELPYFVCGPEPMIAATEHALRELGVPMGNIHSELFDLV